MRLFIEQLWSATREGKPLTRRALLFWYFLRALQYPYMLGLFMRRQYSRYFTPPRAPLNIPVIAVGNLSLGGTGKSVFVDWLVQHAVIPVPSLTRDDSGSNFSLKNYKYPAVLLRGYGSPVLRTQKTFVVSDGKTIFGNASLVGDEPLQIAKRGVAVAIGKDRFKALGALLGDDVFKDAAKAAFQDERGSSMSSSPRRRGPSPKKFLAFLSNKIFFLKDSCIDYIGLGPRLRRDDSQKAMLILEKKNKQTTPIDLAILDDGYQTNTIHKDCTILLIDARAPFENEYLFPAGPLREKDYSRADIIVLTHADQAIHPLSEIKQKYFPDVAPSAITAGRHAFKAFIDPADDEVAVSADTRVVLCSGIAKPQNLEETVRQQKLNIQQHLIFFDHHEYTSKDAQVIIETCRQRSIAKLVTTEKDWMKLQIFHALFVSVGISVLITKITFEFLTPHEYDVFVALLDKTLAVSSATQ